MSHAAAERGDAGGTVFWSEGKVPILVAVDQGATGWSRTKQLKKS